LIDTIKFIIVDSMVLLASDLIYDHQVNGQSSAPFANCISLFMAGDAVQLTEDEDCNSSQWQEAVQYYKANGYPHEDSYMDFGYGKFIELDSDKFVQDKKDLGMD
jgi:hypothetical protein